MTTEPVKPGDAGGPRRPYRSSTRADRAADTRRRILDAAEQLFLERGFAGTTTKAIAASAGVVEKTVFLTFPGKAALLAELIRLRVRGDHPDQRARDSDPWRALESAPANELFPRFASLTTQVLERSARLVVVAEAAVMSDPELGARRDLGHASARATMGILVDALAARGLLSPDLDPELAKDGLFALTSEATYVRLTDGCGWSSADYERWLARTAAAALTVA